MQPDEIAEWVAERVAEGDHESALQLMRDEGHVLPNATRAQLWTLAKGDKHLPM